MSKPKQPVNAGSPAGSSQSPISPNEAALSGAAKAFINGLPREDLVRLVNGHASKSPPNAAAPRSRAGSTDSVKSHRSVQDAIANRQWTSLSSDRNHHLHVPPQPHSASNASKSPNASTASNVSRSPSNVAASNASRSPSNIAAALAAARATPAPSAASPTYVRSLKRTSPAPPARTRTGSSATTTSSSERLDETPIPQTSSLVQLYEQHNSPKQKPKKQPPLITSKPATLQSPKPVRGSSLLDTGLTPLFPSNSEQLVHDRLAAKGLLIDTKGKTRQIADDSDASQDSFTSAKEALSPAKASKPPAPAARRKGRPDVERQFEGSAERRESVKPGIHLQPPSRDVSVAAPIDIRRSSDSRSSFSRAASGSHPSITAAYHQLHPRRMTPLTTGDSLANAIVASSLASSRAPSPHKLPPQPTARPKAASISHSLFSHTPSPPKKGMRMTMRSSSSSSSEEDDVPFAKHKKKKRFIRKHPNKHHEGDRKRWRDAITERERKRYEGVWAANRGLHLFFTKDEQEYLDRHPHGRHVNTIRDQAADQVTDIVTRDIWSRSRLPEDVLEQVWDLVDAQANGRLQKEEFVVGLWLIDQCLKGRKLPVKVTDSVWNSVRFLRGIKVRNK